MVFIIDRRYIGPILGTNETSGSMKGTSIGQAKNAMQILLRSLPEDSMFNSELALRFYWRFLCL
jgi:hypothetical protein